MPCFNNGIKLIWISKKKTLVYEEFDNKGVCKFILIRWFRMGYCSHSCQKIYTSIILYFWIISSRGGEGGGGVLRSIKNLTTSFNKQWTLVPKLDMTGGKWCQLNLSWYEEVLHTGTTQIWRQAITHLLSIHSLASSYVSSNESSKSKNILIVYNYVFMLLYSWVEFSICSAKCTVIIDG